MRFKIGEKVKFLNEVGYGTIISFESETIAIIEDETGFDRKINTEDLVKIIGDHNQVKIEVPVVQKENLFVHEVKKNEFYSVREDFWELDLHSHKIMESEAGLLGRQILQHQLQVFKHVFSKAQGQRQRKLIVIHGVGEGILKAEIRQYLEGCINLEYFDADFREYGKGATEIKLFYK